MRKIHFVALIAVFFGLIADVDPAIANSHGRYEVYGVDDGDMLKLRAGPGIGYDVIVGLPNGTVLRVRHCERIGHAIWCSVSLDRARQLKGFVSYAYLRKL